MSKKLRGSALIAALIIIGVLALVTVATLQLANITKEASARDSRRLSQTACVEAGRQYLLSRLRLFGLDPTTLTLDKSIAVETGNRIVRTAHIDTINNPPPVVTSVVALPPGLVSNASPKARDISNVVAPPSLGGKAYRVVVACSDPLAGNMEMEFTFKYGL